MPKIPWSLGRVVAAALVALACDGGGGGGGPGTATQADADAHASPATVVLLEAGQAPQAVRRYAIEPDLALGGSLLLVELRVVRDGERLTPAREPMLRLPLDAVRTGAHEAGTSIAIGFRAPPSVPPGAGPTERVQAEAARLALGTPIEHVVDEHGLGRLDGRTPAALETPATLAVAGALRGLLRPVPLPEAPIGLGALWESHRELRVGGARVVELARYRITQLAEDQMRVSLYLRQTAAPQSLEDAADGPVALRSHQLEIDGAAILDLRMPLPVDVDVGLGATTVAGGPDAEAATVDRQTAEIRLFVHTPERPPETTPAAPETGAAQKTGTGAGAATGAEGGTRTGGVEPGDGQRAVRTDRADLVSPRPGGQSVGWNSSSRRGGFSSWATGGAFASYRATASR